MRVMGEVNNGNDAQHDNRQNALLERVGPQNPARLGPLELARAWRGDERFLYVDHLVLTLVRLK